MQFNQHDQSKCKIGRAEALLLFPPNFLRCSRNHILKNNSEAIVQLIMSSFNQKVSQEGMIIRSATVSALAQVIICLDSRGVALIKTLSTYLACSDGAYGYMRQQNPCSTRRRVRSARFSFSISFLCTTRSLYVSLEEKKAHKHGALLHGMCFWMMLLFASRLNSWVGTPPELSFFFPSLIYIEGGLAPWLYIKPP